METTTSTQSLVHQAKNIAGTIGKDDLIGFLKGSGFDEPEMENWSKGMLATLLEKCTDENLQKFIDAHGLK